MLCAAYFRKTRISLAKSLFVIACPSIRNSFSLNWLNKFISLNLLNFLSHKNRCNSVEGYPVESRSTTFIFTISLKGIVFENRLTLFLMIKHSFSTIMICLFNNAIKINIIPTKHMLVLNVIEFFVK